jgi:hypothetical protein
VYGIHNISDFPTGYDNDPDSSDESSGESPPERRQSWNATGNEDLLENRAYGDVLQQTAAMGATQDMMVISQPPLINLNNINSYAYPDEVSSTIRIYIIDTGANPNHNVSVAAKLKENANLSRHTLPSSMENHNGSGPVSQMVLVRLCLTPMTLMSNQMRFQMFLGMAPLVFSRKPIFLYMVQISWIKLLNY